MGQTVRRRATSPTALTVALAAGLAAVGAGLAAITPSTPLLPSPLSGGVLLAVLLLAFFVTELGQALVEVRRQAYSFSLAGVPLIVGLLFCPPDQLIVARLLATVIAFAVQRAAWLKFTYNTASYLLDTALVVGVAHTLVGTSPGLTLRTAALCYLSMAVVDLVMSCLVLVVIRINQGPIRGREVVEVLVPAAAFVALNTALGFIAAVLLQAGPLGTTLLAGFVLVTGAVYRGYLVLRRRHQSLELVQGFIERGEGAGSVEELAERLLTHLQVLVRAARVELTLDDGSGKDPVRMSVDDNGAVTIAAMEPGTSTGAGPDWSPAHAADSGEALLLTTRSATPEQRRWLEHRGVRDAIVVPLTRSETRGTLVALDRLGDSTTFTGNDLSMLQALAGHLAVAVHSRQLVQRLRHEATHDILTGLPNRALLIERVRRALAERRTGRAAVLLLDLNRFKEVNDALGHHVGDQLLQVVAARLREVLREGATVARLGGDEFAVLLHPCAEPERDAVAVAERIARALGAPVDLPDATVSTEASIGIAIARPGDSHADLLRHADTAMYGSKASSTGLTVYTPELDRGRAERLALLADLHLALERDDLELRFQPKLDLAFGVVTSVEALVRWVHPTLGPLSPDAFIPLAESTGLIETLTHRVLAKALRQCRIWQDQGIHLAVAVNLPARNINDSALPDQVADALVEAGLPAQKLILEITESSVMGDPERTVPILERLAAIGVLLSLDDFGTGYSSLSYLQKLPVREVKIDRSFILGLTRPQEAHASAILVRSIIGLGTSLGLRIVAEGVETAEVLEQLRGYGCDLIQGYHVGPPMRGEELVQRVPAAGRQSAGWGQAVA
jgi:diguanylate cyclase (GGDEF)-like protein